MAEHEAALMQHDAHSGSDGHNGSEHIHLGKEMRPDDALKKLRTAGSISISPELFEKLYLSPQSHVKGDLRKTFGNPTPIALVGFVIALGPLSCDLMGWRGAGGSGSASIPTLLYFGGVLMLLGGILEFFLGNTFPSVVFCAFGAFYLSFGSTLIPQFAAYTNYAPDASSTAAGLTTQGFNAGFGFITLSMGLLCLVFLVCALRTNVVFVLIFITLAMTFGFVTGAYWALAADFAGNAGYADKLLKGGGACAFCATACGWWVLVAIMLAALDFPFVVPVGDLSTVIRGMSDRIKEKV